MDVAGFLMVRGLTNLYCKDDGYQNIYCDGEKHASGDYKYNCNFTNLLSDENQKEGW